MLSIAPPALFPARGHRHRERLGTGGPSSNPANLRVAEKVVVNVNRLSFHWCELEIGHLSEARAAPQELRHYTALLVGSVVSAPVNSLSADA